MDIKQELEQILNDDLSYAMQSVASAYPQAVLIQLALSIAAFFGAVYFLKKKTKENKKLSNRIKEILKDGKDWKVMVLDTKVENAFCMGLPIIYITSGIIKKNDERTVEAIMLHEAGHIKNYDSPKMLARTGPGTAFIVAMLMAGVSGPIIGFIGAAMFILTMVSGITYGRKAEKRADDLAIKYGYGKEIAKYFQKAIKQREKIRQKELAPYNNSPGMAKLYDSLERIGEIFDTHPRLEDRVKSALNGAALYRAAKSTKNIKALSIKIYKMIAQKI